MDNYEINILKRNGNWKKVQSKRFTFGYCWSKNTTQQKIKHNEPMF